MPHQSRKTITDMFLKTGSHVASALTLTLVLLASGIPNARAMDVLATGDVQIRATAPGMTATGGYLTIHNHSDEDDRLVGVVADLPRRPKFTAWCMKTG